MVRIIIVITHEFNGLALETQPINIMKCKHITMYIARAIKKKLFVLRFYRALLITRFTMMTNHAITVKLYFIFLYTLSLFNNNNNMTSTRAVFTHDDTRESKRLKVFFFFFSVQVHQSVWTRSVTRLYVYIYNTSTPTETDIFDNILLEALCSELSKLRGSVLYYCARRWYSNMVVSRNNDDRRVSAEKKLKKKKKL